MKSPSPKKSGKKNIAGNNTLFRDGFNRQSSTKLPPASGQIGTNGYREENKFKNNKNEPIQVSQQLGPLHLPINLPMG